MQYAVPFLIFLTVFVFLWGLFRLVGPPWLRAISAVTRRISRVVARRETEEWVIWAGIGAGLVAAVVAGAFFLEVAESIREETPAIDRVAYEWIRSSRTDRERPFFVAFTIIGKPIWLAVIVGVAAAILFARGVRDRREWIGYLAIVTIGGGLLGRALKLYFSRARPDLAQALFEASGFSFPSGHALGSTIVFGSLAYVCVHKLPGWTSRSAALALAMASILAVCFSRLYLGVHWLSDIAGGISAGIVWLAATTVSFEVLRRVWRLRRSRKV